MSKVIETDLKTFIKFWLVPIGIILLLAFLSAAKVGLIVVGLSIFLALALRPLVKRVYNFFCKHFGSEKKYRSVSAISAYLIVVVVIGGILAIVGPVVITETTRFIQHFPETFEHTIGGWDGINNFGKTIGIENLQNEVSNAVSGFAKQLSGALGADIVSSVSNVADTIMKVFLVLILTMLFLLDGPSLMEGFWRKMNQDGENEKSIVVYKRVVSRMGGVVSTYVSRQAMIAVLDGVASCLIVFCLSLFTDISSGLAIPMGLITMVFYMIPMFGQLIGGTLVTLILLFTNPLAAIIFAAIYIVYAQVENNVISPKVQGDALRLPAVVILSAVIIGMYMFGLLGAIIAVPIAGCIRVLVDEYPNIRTANRR